MQSYFFTVTVTFFSSPFRAMTSIMHSPFPFAGILPFLFTFGTRLPLLA